VILTGTLSQTDTSTSVWPNQVGHSGKFINRRPDSRANFARHKKLFGLSRLEISRLLPAPAQPDGAVDCRAPHYEDLTVTYSTNIASDPNQVLALSIACRTVCRSWPNMNKAHSATEYAKQ